MMPKSYAPLSTTLGIVVLSAVLGLFLWAGDRPAFSDIKKISPENQFLLPQIKETGFTPDENRGKALYQYYCVTCHGDAGNGDGFNSFSITPSPAKLSDAKLMVALSDATIQQAIKKGGSGVGLSPHMPPWGEALTNKNIIDLTHFIRTLSNAKIENTPPKK